MYGVVPRRRRGGRRQRPGARVLRVVRRTAVMGAAIAVVLVTVAAGWPANPSDARVQFTTRVSGPSPFDESCDDSRAESGLTGAEVEVHLSVDPTEPDHLLGTWQQDRYDGGGGARSNLASVSRDGGLSWRSSQLPGLSRCTDPGNVFTRTTDPWTAIGPDGVAYQTGNPSFLSDIDADLDVTVSVARDGGLRWGRPERVAVDDGIYLHERPVITADPRQPGDAYVVWARHTEPEPDVIGAGQALDVAIGFSATHDGGDSWSEPVVVPPDAPEVLEWPYGLVVIPQPDRPDRSRIVALYATQPARAIPWEQPSILWSVHSDDQGATWSPPRKVGQALNLFPTGDYEHLIPIAGGSGTLSAGSGPDGSIHVVWFDSTTTGDPAQVGSIIHHARSDDGGESWHGARIAEFEHQAFLPAVAVAADGSIGATFYDLRNDVLRDEEDELTTDLWLRYSRDGGERWEELHVAGPFDLRRAPLSGGRYMLGDYQGLVGLPHGFGALYAVAPPLATDGSSDVLFSRIKLAPRPSASARVRVR